MLYYLFAFLYVLVCFVLLLVVLVQQGKAGDIASAFGGGGSQAAFGARSGATLLTKVTWVCATLFVLGAIGLSIIGVRGPGSVVGAVPVPESQQQSTPAAPAPAPAETPAQPAPEQPAQPAPEQPQQ